MRVGLVVNESKPRSRSFVPALCRWLNSHGHTSMLTPNTAKTLGLHSTATPVHRLVRSSDLILALGGDGTLLRAARMVSGQQIPLMGINLGGLGFLTAFSLAEARQGITDFARGRHREEPRRVLQCRSGKNRGIALNDCVLNMGPTGRVVEVTVYRGSVFVNRFVGDGIVVATPTGSTAYSLAAGGPVVFPTMEALLLTPICPHALAARPLVLPGNIPVRLRLSTRSNRAVLSIDGQLRWPITPGQDVSVTLAPFVLRLVVPRTKTYFKILRDKMKWAGSQV
ncbi:MAG: NAD(+)/NADH kinase [candidate division WOR-3 bacterium]